MQESARRFNELGGILKFLRIEQGLSQEYCARQLGVTQKTYSNYERDISKISLDQFVRLFQFLQMNSSELVRILMILLEENMQHADGKMLMESNARIKSLLSRQISLLKEMEKNGMDGAPKRSKSLPKSEGLEK